MSQTPANQMDQALALRLFTYRDSTIYWRHPRKIEHEHRQAGCFNNSNGYMTVGHDNVSYQVHNIIWNMHFGQIEEGLTVDHIDRNKINNALSNLRLATGREQQLNKNIRSDNKSGHRNISWDKYNKKWRVVTRDNGKQTYLGRFDDIEDAVIARDAHDRHVVQLTGPDRRLTQK